MGKYVVVSPPLSLSFPSVLIILLPEEWRHYCLSRSSTLYAALVMLAGFTHVLDTTSWYPLRV
ncbi:hypothetical protein F5X96DRAFT_621339 [Biscogniauxia mediterranea]|nr:hypothetical protein F5X96DRAFT_621339 [Biscogniauxia mediterranea]